MIAEKQGAATRLWTDLTVVAKRLSSGMYLNQSQLVIVLLAIERDLHRLAPGSMPWLGIAGLQIQLEDGQRRFRHRWPVAYLRRVLEEDDIQAVGSSDS